MTKPLFWDLPPTYATPASSYPLKTVRSASIDRRPYRKKAIYEMYGVRGYKYWTCARTWHCTCLTIHGKTWMVDDPAHFEGMSELAERARPGRVLVTGLGLGLIVHALAKRSDITEIVVIEREADVIELIEPLLPIRSRIYSDEQMLTKPAIRIIEDDFWRYARTIKPGAFSTAIIDLWVGDGATLWPEVHAAQEAFDEYFPETLSLWFGFQAAVDRKRRLVSIARDAFASLRPEQRAMLNSKLLRSA